MNNFVSKVLQSFVLLSSFFLVFATAAVPAEPTFKQGETIFIETGVEAPDRNPTWYASMVAKPYAPVFEMLATRGTQGRYYPYTYPVTLKDIVRFHGHDCEGLTHASNAAWVAFKILFPDGIVDRSVLWGISGESPCWSDTVAFLSGARLQYGNLGFFKDNRYGHAIVLYREDTKMAVLATWKEGINNIPGEPVMLPGKITWKPKMTMQDVEALKAVVKKAGGKPTPYQVDLMRYQQWSHLNDILEHPLEESYQVKIIDNFKWEEWIDIGKTVSKPHQRSDTRLKNYPYRAKPVMSPIEGAKP
jgi:formylmethanofuran dehydrogenase subunit E